MDQKEEFQRSEEGADSLHKLKKDLWGSLNLDVNISDTKSNASMDSDSTETSTPMRNRLRMDFWSDEKDESSNDVVISSLAPGLSSTEDYLKIRVTYSGEAFESKGKRVLVHNFNGIDKEQVEISFVSFAKRAQQMESLIKPNAVFKISHFEVKPSVAGFEKCGNKLEIRILSETAVEEISDPDFPEMPLKLEGLNDVLLKAENEVVDVLAVVAVDFMTEDIKKKGSTSDFSKKRDLLLTDQSKKSVLFTIWGKLAENLIIEHHAVVLIRKAQVAVISGRHTLKTSVREGTLVLVNPEFEGSKSLKAWFDSENEKRMKLKKESEKESS